MKNLSNRHFYFSNLVYQSLWHKECSYCGSFRLVTNVFCRFPAHKYSMRRDLCSNCIKYSKIKKW